MDFSGGAVDPVPVGAPEREDRVLDQERIETEIAGHANGGFDRVVRDHSGDVERRLPSGPEPGFEIRPDEGTIGLFGDDGLAIARCRLGLEIVPGLAGSIVRRRLAGIVAHMINGPPARSPGGQQRSDVLLRLRIVAFAPTRMIDSPLYIDHDQCCRSRKRTFHQKLTRSASCRYRAGRATETTPKSAAPRVRPGTSKFAWLSRLYASARRSARQRSVTRMDRSRVTSVVWIGAARRPSRGELPKVKD